MEAMTENPGVPNSPIAPTKRNALMTWLIPTLCFVAAPPLGNFLGTTAFRFAPTAAIICGVFLAGGFLAGMVKELNSVTGGKLVYWHFFIPLYGLYWAAALVPAEMAKAKQKAGKAPPRVGIAYLFVCLYALAADLNDLA